MSADRGHLAHRMSLAYLTLPAAHDVTPAGTPSPRRATHFPHPDLDGFNTSRANMASSTGATHRTTTFVGFGPERPQSSKPQSWYAGNGLPQGYMDMSHEQLRQLWCPPLDHFELCILLGHRRHNRGVAKSRSRSSATIGEKVSGYGSEASDEEYAPVGITEHTYPPTVIHLPEALPHEHVNPRTTGKRARSSSPSPSSSSERSTNRRRIDSPTDSLSSEGSDESDRGTLVDESTANGWKGKALKIYFDFGRKEEVCDELEWGSEDGEDIIQLAAIAEDDGEGEVVDHGEQNGSGPAQNGSGLVQSILPDLDWQDAWTGEVDPEYIDPSNALFGSLTFEEAEPPQSTWDESDETRRAGIAFVWRNRVAFGNMDLQWFHMHLGCEEGWCPCGA